MDMPYLAMVYAESDVRACDIIRLRAMLVVWLLVSVAMVTHVICSVTSARIPACQLRHLPACWLVGCYGYLGLFSSPNLYIRLRVPVLVAVGYLCGS